VERHGHTREVESLADFDRLVAAGATRMRHWRVQSLDLTGRTEELMRLDAHGSIFLGCSLEHAAESALRADGGLVFPPLPDAPLDPYRASLYTPAELYDGGRVPYDATLDARAYAWAQGRLELADTLAQALHDHAVDDALEEYVAGRELVGVMGGHAVLRGSEVYLEAARLGQALARSGLTVATGGGPGAMEAANLGAYLADHDETVLAEAVGMLAAAPGYDVSVAGWVAAAFDVLERWPDGRSSLGVPTWFYGHEPPNAFATDIAKYFKNAIREDTLLHVCQAGIAFLPGRAGTVQEIFQDACENYYADDDAVAPMVLVDSRHWTRELPAWPLLQALAADRGPAGMAGSVHLVDTLEEATALLAPPGRDGTAP
jgi:predicted Rossmann-fold nucleotide-binding protein